MCVCARARACVCNACNTTLKTENCFQRSKYLISRNRHVQSYSVDLI